MTRRLMLSAVAHGLLVTSAVVPAASLVATDAIDDPTGTVVEIDGSEPDLFFINGKAFVLG